jgi:hypothetical protein
LSEFTNNLVDVSTVIAATAGLWALAFAWLTYVMAVRQQNQQEFLALRSIVAGLRVELDRMIGWTGAGSAGYSKGARPEPDWSIPGRLIYKFDIEAISKLTLSPLLYSLGDIIDPFAKLSFSVSRLFQVYDEYRSFVNADPAVFLGSRVPSAQTEKVKEFNRIMHVELIGGADSTDPVCLYKTYGAAVSALKKFDGALSLKRCPRWFMIGHLFAGVCVGAGIVLLIKFVKP